MKLPHKLVSGCLRAVDIYYLATLKDGGSHGVFAMASLTSHRKHNMVDGWESDQIRAFSWPGGFQMT